MGTKPSKEKTSSTSPSSLHQPQSAPTSPQLAPISPQLAPTPPQLAPTSLRAAPLDIPELLEKINPHRVTPWGLVWVFHYPNECMEEAILILEYVERIKSHLQSVIQKQCQVKNQQWMKVIYQALKDTHTQRLQYLKQQLDQERNQDTKVVGLRRLYEPTPILDFDLSGTYASTMIYERFPYLPHLTRLRIDQNSDYHVYPFKIFQGCPHLQYLYVGSKTRVEMFGDWLFSASEEQQPFTLRELILRNTYFNQDKLEEFLRFTPHLTDLHLSNLSIKGISPFPPKQRYDCKALIAVIKSLGLPLKTFQFSVYEGYRESWDALVDGDLFKSI